MVISVNRTKLKHAAKGQKRAVPPEFLFFAVLNFNNLLVTCCLSAPALGIFPPCSAIMSSPIHLEWSGRPSKR